MAALFVSASSLAQPATNGGHEAGELVFQLPSFKPGDTWKYRNYQLPSGALNRTWVEKVQAVNDQGIIIQRVDRIPPNDTIERQKPTLRRFGEKSLRAPLKVGMSWREPLVEDGVHVGESECVVAGRERISVRAGEFDTMAIECRYSHSSKTYHTIGWCSPSARNIVRHFCLRSGKPYQATELTSLKLR